MKNTLSTADVARIELLKKIKAHAHAMRMVATYAAVEYRIDEDIRAIQKGKP